MTAPADRGGSSGDTGVFAGPLLDANGLNLRAVLALAALPPHLLSGLAAGGADVSRYTQVLLVGHGGRTLWAALQAWGCSAAEPIDDFTVGVIQRFFAARDPAIAYEILYPGRWPLPLQALGSLAGWAQPSPLGLGINAQWGLWHAYRAVVLAATNFEVSVAPANTPPCACCVERPCIRACPADATADDGFLVERCVAYRKTGASSCRLTCLARTSCPVAREHRYSDEQIRYHYGRSMATIERWY